MEIFGCIFYNLLLGQSTIDILNDDPDFQSNQDCIEENTYRDDGEDLCHYAESTFGVTSGGETD